jgi:hypothetical protein
MGFAYGVEVQGAFAYVLDQWIGLRIVDVSNPAAPALAGSVPISGSEGHWLAVSGTKAYIPYAEAGLRIVDVTNPYSPYEVGSVDTGSWPLE